MRITDISFNKAFEKTVGHEGGFQKDPFDNGNWTGGKREDGVLKGTKFGISAGSYPDEDIENLTIDRAKELYHKDFWQKQSCHLMEGNEEIAIELFDTSVNAGIGKGAKIFQEAINLSNRNEKDYKDIDVDGAIGAKTISAFRSCKYKRTLFNIMNVLQGMHYINLMRSNSGYEKYIGWFDRLEIRPK